MCKYCDCKENPHLPSLGCRGAEIVPGAKYIGCQIEYSKSSGEYSIYVAGDNEDWSEPISFCPFCGRKLKE